jgi:hypothetical protein
VLTNAAFGGGQLIRSVERLGHRSAMRRHGRIERGEVLAQHVDRTFRPPGPERDALAGSDVGVKRCAQIEQGLERLPGGAAVGDVVAIGASEGGLIINRPIGESGRDEETDYQQSETNRLAEHRSTE